MPLNDDLLNKALTGIGSFVGGRISQNQRHAALEAAANTPFAASGPLGSVSGTTGDISVTPSPQVQSLGTSFFNSATRTQNRRNLFSGSDLADRVADDIIRLGLPGVSLAGESLASRERASGRLGLLSGTIGQNPAFRDFQLNVGDILTRAELAGLQEARAQEQFLQTSAGNDANMFSSILQAPNALANTALNVANRPGGAQDVLTQGLTDAATTADFFRNLSGTLADTVSGAIGDSLGAGAGQIASDTIGNLFSDTASGLGAIGLGAAGASGGIGNFSDLFGGDFLGGGSSPLSPIPDSALGGFSDFSDPAFAGAGGAASGGGGLFGGGLGLPPGTGTIASKLVGAALPAAAALPASATTGIGAASIFGGAAGAGEAAALGLGGAGAGAAPASSLGGLGAGGFLAGPAIPLLGGALVGGLIINSILQGQPTDATGGARVNADGTITPTGFTSGSKKSPENLAAALQVAEQAQAFAQQNGVTIPPNTEFVVGNRDGFRIRVGGKVKHTFQNAQDFQEGVKQFILGQPVTKSFEGRPAADSAAITQAVQTGDVQTANQIIASNPSPEVQQAAVAAISNNNDPGFFFDGPMFLGDESGITRLNPQLFGGGFAGGF